MTLVERHAEALVRAMQLSRQRQDMEAQLSALSHEMVKQAGAIDLLEILIAEAQKAGGDGV